MSDVQAKIAEDVKNNPVLLYMKGSPVFPQCGFSSGVGGDMGRRRAIDIDGERAKFSLVVETARDVWGGL